MMLYPINKIGQSVTLRVEVWSVNLINITCKDDLSPPLAGSGYYCFHLMWGKILSFIYNKKKTLEILLPLMYANGCITNFSFCMAAVIF